MKKENIKDIKLTKKQLSLVNDQTYPNYLISCAGTGKTEIIANKIINLIKSGIALNKIALITFTNKATHEMKERLHTLLYQEYLKTNNGFLRSQIDYLGFAEINTIHTFCLNLLQTYGLQINIAPNFIVSNFSFEIKNIIFDEFKKYYENTNDSLIPSYKIVEIIKDLYDESAERELEINFTELPNSNDEIDKIKLTIKKIYQIVVKRIEDEKFSKNVLTPNDLIKYSIKLFQDKHTAKLIANEYSYVFVDEFQDTNQNQFNLLKLMMKNGSKIFIAGDQNQSIYSFRGADLTNFNKMISEMKVESSGQILTENFRADANLLKEINSIFNSKFYFNKTHLNFKHTNLVGLNKGKIKNSVNIIYSSNLYEVIMQIIADGKTYNDIAILCRTNNELNQCAAILNKAQIPAVVYGGKSFYKSAYIIDVYKILYALVYAGKINDQEMVYTQFYLSYKKYSNENFKNLFLNLKYDVKKMSLSNFLNSLYEKTFIIKYLKDFNYQQELANLYKLMDLCRNYNNISSPFIEFISFLDIMISIEKEEEQAEIPFNKIKNAVAISTIHKAKGLSFNNVIIPFIDKNLYSARTKPKVVLDEDNTFGLDADYVFANNDNTIKDSLYQTILKRKTINYLEEELRILFVAMTRAKEKVWLLTSNSRNKLEYRIKKNNNYISYFKWLNALVSIKK